MKVTYPKIDHECQIICFLGWEFQFCHKKKILYTWQLLDPAGSLPDPGIEITYPKCDQVCKILCFLSGNSNFDIKNDFFVHLVAPDSHPDQGMKVTDLTIDHVSQILCF